MLLKKKLYFCILYQNRGNRASTHTDMVDYYI